MTAFVFFFLAFLCLLLVNYFHGQYKLAEHYKAGKETLEPALGMLLWTTVGILMGVIGVLSL